MRILHVIAALDPKAGGPPRVAAQLSSAMAEQGHEVTLLTQGAGAGGEIDPKTLPSAFSWVPGIHRLKVVELPRQEGLSKLTYSGAREKLRELVSAHDVVHFHGVWEPILYRTARMARSLGVPYVVRPAGMLDPWSLQQRWLKKRVALALGYRAMLNSAAFIHALNRDERDLIALLDLKCPIEVIPNGTFVEWMDQAPARGKFIEKYPQLAGRPFVLFLSRLHYKKGLDYLADGFKELAGRMPEAMLVVAGPDEGAQADFEARIKAHGLSDRVLLPGALYARAKYEALADAACFCLPSRQEGFSVAVIESLSIGTPVVISPACHFPEVDAAGAGFTVETQPHAIANALERLLGDPILNARQSEAGVRLIRDRYTWSSIVRTCLTAYRKHGASGDLGKGERGQGGGTLNSDAGNHTGSSTPPGSASQPTFQRGHRDPLPQVAGS